MSVQPNIRITHSPAIPLAPQPQPGRNEEMLEISIRKIFALSCAQTRKDAPTFR